MARAFSLLVRRVGQTPKIAKNFPRIYADLASTGFRPASKPLTFELRNGLVVSTPNTPGARVPVYELFAEDAYHIDELVAGLPDDLVVLDIGAQVGCFSLALSLARPNARIYSFEASEHTTQWLRQNVERNHRSDRIVVTHAAVTKERGTLRFLDNAAGSALNGLTSTSTESQYVDVPAITFADAVESAGGRVDLVKIDTEGAEYDIILNSKPEDWASVKRIVIEYHKVEGRQWAELREFFETAGLRQVREESVVPGWGAVWLDRA